MALASKNKSNGEKVAKKATEEAANEAKESEATKTEESEAVISEKGKAAASEKGKAVTVKKKGDHKMVKGGGGMELVLKECADQLPPIEFGTLPMVKASQGALVCEGDSLGKRIEFIVVSFNDKFAVTPNENNADSSYCKFSYDNVELSDGTGTTVKEHIAYLQEEGYDKACSKRYLEVVGILEDSDEDHDEIGNMVVLNLSPMSVKQFERYRLQSTVKIKQGKLEESQVNDLVVTAKTQTFGSNTFTIMTFSNNV